MIPRNFRQNPIYFLARKLLQTLKEGLTFEKETITIKCNFFLPRMKSEVTKRPSFANFFFQ